MRNSTTEQSFTVNILLRRLLVSVGLLLLLLGLNSTALAQLQGVPCNAHRWLGGDGWRFNTTTQIWEALNVGNSNPPAGIVRCASSAETESSLEQFRLPYNSSLFNIGNNTNCFNQQNETRGIGVTGPTNGEDIIWLNFDIRPLAGTYQFQIVSNERLGWALFHVEVPSAGPPATNTSTGTYPAFTNNANNALNLSGDCSKLVYADCGLSGNGWSTITVPSFTKPTNYYLAMWSDEDAIIQNSVNLNFKARFGCGGSTCALEKSGADAITCNANGTYKVCADFFGSAGQWTLSDLAAVKATSYEVKTYTQFNVLVNTYTSTNLTTTPIAFILGTIAENGPVKATICAVYGDGNPYNITLTGANPPNPPQGYVTCTVNGSFSGNAPPRPTKFTLTGGSVCGDNGVDVILSGSQLNVNYQLQKNGVNVGSAVAGTGSPINFGPQGTGTYVVVATSTQTGACTTTSDPAQVTQNPALVVDAVATNVSCFGGADGKITVGVTGGTAPFSYKLGAGNFQASNEFTGLTAGTYTVTVQDSKGCTGTDEVTITQPPIVTLSLEANDVSCFGGNDGSIEATFGGGTPPYQIKLGAGGTYNAATSPHTFSGIIAGNYVVFVKDANGCEKSQNITVGQPTAVTLSLEANNVSCFSGNDGSIEATFGGGTPPYQVKLGAGGTYAAATSPHTFNGLTAGNYTVFVKDAEGCEKSQSITVGQPTVVTLSLEANNVSCFGGNDGSIEATFGGGTPPYQIKLGAGGTYAAATSPHTFNGLTAGNYTVFVKDAEGCEKSQSITVGQPTVVTLSLESSPVSCFGGNDGSIEATFGGGTPPYQIKLGAGGTYAAATSPHTFNGLTAGNYTVFVKDAEGCEKSQSITVGQASVVTLSLEANNVSCFGGDDGSIEATFGGGTPPYQIKLGAGGTYAAATSPHTFTGLTAGNYTVFVKDAEGCEKSQSITVGQPTIVTLSLEANNVSCFGGNDGSIEATFGGGTPPYQIKLGAGGTYAPATSPHTFNGLAAGNYTVFVKDAEGCEKSQSITVGQPTIVTLSLEANNVSCFGGNDGSIEATFGGGTPPYQVKLGAGGTYAPATSPHTFNGLTAGNYTVFVKDAEGCEKSQSITVGQPTIVTLTLEANNVSCFGGNDGSIEATFGGGTPPYQIKLGAGGTYAPATSPHTFNGLTAGNYTVYVKDAEGCEKSQSITVGQASVVTLLLEANNVSCFGGDDGSIEATFGGGTPPYQIKLGAGGTYAAATSPHTFTGLTAGNYTVFVKDAEGCEKSQSITVGQPTIVTLSLEANNVSCFGGNDGSIEATFGGGTPPYQIKLGAGGTYAPATSPHTFNGLTAGNYTVFVKDAEGCEKSQSITVGQASVVTLSLEANNVSCFGGNDGSIEATFGGGTPPYQIKLGAGGTYAPATSPHTFNGLTAGNYTVFVKDAEGCEKSQSITVGQPTIVTLTLEANNVSCFGGNDGSIEATFGGGTPPYQIKLGAGGTYAPATSPHTFNGLTAGNYTVYVIDAEGCEKYKSITVGQPTIVTLSLEANNVSCFGGNDGSIEATFGGGTPPYQVKLGAGGTYAPATSPHTFNGLTAGNYTVFVKDAEGCEKSQSITVGQPTIVTLSLEANNVSCFGGNDGSIEATFGGGTPPYQIKLGAGGTYAPATSPHTFNGLTAGNYTVFVKDAEGCEKSQSITVGQPTIVTLSLEANNVSCFGGNDGSIEATFGGGTPPYQVKLGAGGSYAAATSPHTFNGLTAGNYTVFVKDAEGCEKSQSITVGQPTVVTLSLQSFPVSCFGGNDGSIEATFGGGTPPYQVKLGAGGTYAAATSPHTFTGLTAGNYTVYVKDAEGCEKYLSISVTQPTVVTLALQAYNVSCFGGADGSIKATFGGGVPPYQIKLGAGGTYAAATSPHTFTGLVAGNYTVYVKDAEGCEKSQSISVTQPPIVTLSLLGTNVSCFGGNNGSIQATFGGGTPPYQIKLGAGGTYAAATSPHTFNGLTAGNYTVYVKDAKGCEKYKTITITQPPVLACVIKPTTPVVICAGGTAQLSVTASGGTSPYTYEWSVAEAGASIQSGQGTANVTVAVGNTPGTVTVSVKITDSKGCIKTCTKTISVINCLVNCTYTQGFYGSTNGKACTQSGEQLYAKDLIAKAIGNMPGQVLYLGQGANSGATGGSFTAGVADAAKLNAILPGGTTASTLAGDYNLTAAGNYPPLNSGKIANVLLSQTIALKLNVYQSANSIVSLGGLPLQAGKWLVTMKKDPASTCADPKALPCYKNGANTNSISSVQMPANVVNALSDKTVFGLLQFASEALGGKALPAGVSLSNINNAVDIINNAFDNCRFFVGWSDCKVDCSNIGTACPITYNTFTPNYQLISSANTGIQPVSGARTSQSVPTAPVIKASPNPFSERAQFNIQADTDYKNVTVEVYNLLGQKMSVAFRGSMRKGETRQVEFRPQQMLTGGIIYHIRMDNRSFTGKLLYDSKGKRF